MLTTVYITIAVHPCDVSWSNLGSAYAHANAGRPLGRGRDRACGTQEGAEGSACTASARRLGRIGRDHGFGQSSAQTASKGKASALSAPVPSPAAAEESRVSRACRCRFDRKAPNVSSSRFETRAAACAAGGRAAGTAGEMPSLSAMARARSVVISSASTPCCSKYALERSRFHRTPSPTAASSGRRSASPEKRPTSARPSAQ